MQNKEKKALLSKLLDESYRVRDFKSVDPKFQNWKHAVDRALVRIFGDDSLEVNRFRGLAFFNMVSVIRPGRLADEDAKDRAAFLRDLEIVQLALRSYMEEFQETDEGTEETQPFEQTGEPENVFIVHGHDRDFAEVVARFIEKRGLNGVILHEQPNKSRTIIEKFEQHAITCRYAIVLFTPDDEGRERNGTGDLRPRARQNVLLELGYFIGRLHRARVAVIYDESVELPSDYHGVLYIPKDDMWRSRLADELEAAGMIKRNEAPAIGDHENG